MQITYEIRDFAGVPNGRRFLMEDNDANTRAWQGLSSDWAVTMECTLGVGPPDYELGSWHHGMMSVFAHLYSRSFYHPRFVHDVIEILSRHGQCFAKFECFNESETLGNLIVLPDGLVILDSLAVQTGLARSLGYVG